jgi:hypothetical protein
MISALNTRDPKIKPENFDIFALHLNFYEKNLNNFNLRTENLRDALYQKQIESEETDQTQTIDETIKHIRTTIVTEDLMPLRYKICKILEYIKSNELYHINPDQAFNKIKYSPRIKIIDSMITTLKDDTITLDDTTIKNYQLNTVLIQGFIIHLIGHATNCSLVRMFGTMVMTVLKLG